MTVLAILAVLAVIAAGGWRLTRMALRYGHLLMLRAPGGATTLYERGSDGRYAWLPAVQLPAALRRFVCGVPAEERVRARGPRNGER
ncbi:hypothetical protein [Longimicrobium sp.]|uniref:hypothetical protein n=1 Tax=Longimicrobium sp. TaxID=2029185 RepID=UPI003B3AC5FA